MANNWEEYVQTHDKEGYTIMRGGDKIDADGNLVGKGKTIKEETRIMEYDKLFNEIDGIIKNNALTDEKRNEVIEESRC